MSERAPREGDYYAFTERTTDSGWTFDAGQVVRLVNDHAPYLDWFAHVVETEDGLLCRIGAGVLRLHATRVSPLDD